MLIVVAILDYMPLDKRKKWFRRTRGILFMLLGGVLIFSTIAMYNDDRNSREEKKQLTERIEILQDSNRQADNLDAIRYSELIKRFEMIQTEMDRFTQKARTKLSDLEDQKGLNKLIEDWDSLKVEVQKLKHPTGGVLPTFKLIISVSLSRAQSQVFIDGELKGIASSGPIEVTEGQHELRLEYSAARLPTGYKLEFRRDIVISKDTIIHISNDEFQQVKISEEKR